MTPAQSVFLAYAHAYLEAAAAAHRPSFEDFRRAHNAEWSARQALIGEPEVLAAFILAQQTEIERLSQPQPVTHGPYPGPYQRGDYVRKKGSGGAWHGVIVGYYSTSKTEIGYNVESVYEPGSVQIYPARALEPWQPPQELSHADH